VSALVADSVPVKLECRTTCPFNETNEPGPNITVDRSAMPVKWKWPLGSPLKLRASAVSIEWKPTLEAPLPAEPCAKVEPVETIALVPYGCTKFRISMFPVTARTFRLAESAKPK
jgi:hypothetical protein